MVSNEETGRDDSPPVPPQGEGGFLEPEVIEGGLDDGPSSSGRADSPEMELVGVESLDESWAPYFRYETAYRDQVDAIDTFLDLLAGNGYYLLEGACGTGKTLAAVTAGIHAIRDRDQLTKELESAPKFPDYSRLLVVTPVKQQMKQFVEEMRGINNELPSGVDSIPTVVMRGRTDMMPYSYVDLPPFDEHGVGDKMDDLREMTAELIRFGSDIPLDWPDEMTPPEFSYYDYDWTEASSTAKQHRERYRFDPVRADAVQKIVSNMDAPNEKGSERLTVNGVETPYPKFVPHTNNVVDTNTLNKHGADQLPLDLQGKFDPFYAGFFASTGGLPFGFGRAESHVFDQHELFREAASRGICPHEAMSDLASDAEVILGNYTHLFDPGTRLLTDDKIGLLDDETITVVDEAHQLEGRVRDMLSVEIDLYTLDRAINDVQIARQYAVGETEKTPTSDLNRKEAGKAKQVVKKAMDTAGNYSVTIDDLREVEQFLTFAQQKLAEYGADSVDEEFKNATWQEAVEYGWDLSDIENALSDPDDSADPDDFLEDTLKESKFGKSTFTKVYQVMLAIKFIYEQLEEEGIYDRTPQGVEVGDFFRRWAVADDVEYHRHVLLEHSEKENIPIEFPEWVRAWTPKFQLYNCIPRDELRNVFAGLGGGVLMSATIQPDEVFKEAVGIGEIPYPDGDDEEDGSEGAYKREDEESRPIEFEQYPLRFPPENRLSLTVDVPKFINKNRGERTTRLTDMSRTREQYAKVLHDIASTKGNILVAMPSYAEAQWAHDYIEKRGISKRLHLDQSSSDWETQQTLESFFAEGDAVIFTSCRGTITEGVDYDGAKLHCCVAVGIPLLPTYQPRIRATQTAYDEKMDFGSGFETALTVPAVRKVRQAFGRVIRGSDEVGVRVLLDERYASSDFYGVEEYLSEQEQQEFQLTSPQKTKQAISRFWKTIDEHRVTVTGVGGGDDGTRKSDKDDTLDEDTPKSNETEKREEEDNGSDTGESSGPTSYSKIYFGQEANLSNWTPIETEVAENEIVPLVHEHEIENPGPGEKTIKLNFAKELSASGWTDLPSEIVYDEIEPIARRAMRR